LAALNAAALYQVVALYLFAVSFSSTFWKNDTVNAGNASAIRTAVRIQVDGTDARRTRARLDQRLIGTSLGMGATLSKLWASLRSAFAGGAPAAKSGQQHPHQTTTTAIKDVESGTNTPPTTTTDSTMPEVKKYEITEVCMKIPMRRFVRWDGGGNERTPAEVIHLIESLTA
jgi:hypothetical protein